MLAIMKISKTPPQRNIFYRRPLWIGLAILLLGLFLWNSFKKNEPKTKELLLPPAPPADSVIESGIPFVVDAANGVIATPITSAGTTVNIAIYKRGTGTRKLLFNRSLSVNSITKMRFNGEMVLALAIASEDTNSNGKVDPFDIHQLYWYSPSTAKLTKIAKPFFNFISYVDLIQMGSDDAAASGGNVEFLYKVSIDNNHNGTRDSDDPIQFVLVNFSSSECIEILPHEIVPSANIPTADATPN